MPWSWVPGSFVADHFEVVRPLGRGGYGAVELVNDRRTGAFYAAKHAIVDQPASLHRLMQEAQRWLSMPPHPNVATCRFIRSTVNEIAILVEYVDGMPLHEFRAANPALSIAQILDIGIQTASGLAHAHQAGVAHLDVKPHNVLVGNDSVVKVVDFGIGGQPLGDAGPAMVGAMINHAVNRATPEERATVAAEVRDEIIGAFAAAARMSGGDEAKAVTAANAAMREFMGDADAAEAEHRILSLWYSLATEATQAPNRFVRGASGFSIGYASLEQAEGRLLTFESDVWSWGLTLLDLFAGERTWVSGTLASAALAATPVVPPQCRELLQRCFDDRPAERPTFEEVLDVLVELYEAAAGRPYERSGPQSSDGWTAPSSPTELDRRVETGASWTDPRAWLWQAYIEAGLPPESSIDYWPAQTGSRRAQVVQDLGAMVVAKSTLLAITEPAPSVIELIGALSLDLARVHMALGDHRAAQEVLEDALHLHPALQVDREAALWNTLAICRRSLGDLVGARAASEASLHALELLTEPAAESMCGSLVVFANTLLASGDAPGALRLLDRALEVDGAREHFAGLARIHLARGKALVLVRDDHVAGAWVAAREAIASLPSEHPDGPWLGAMVDLSEAEVSDDPMTRVGTAERALIVLEQLAEGEHGRHAVDIGRAHFYAGYGFEYLDEPVRALVHYRQATVHLEIAVREQGFTSHATELARAFQHESTLVRLIEGAAAAIRPAAEAVQVWRLLGAADPDAKSSLIHGLERLAVTQLQAGDLVNAGETLAEADAMLASTADVASGLVAAVRAARGLALRKEGRSSEGARMYASAAEALADDADSLETLNLRGVIHGSRANALTECQDYWAALAANSASVECYEASEDRMGAPSVDLLVARHQTGACLRAVGRYEDALRLGAEAQRAFEKLVTGGRTDLAMRVCESVLDQALAYERQHTVASSIEVFRRALSRVAAFGINLAPAITAKLTSRLDRLTGMEAWSGDDCRSQLSELRPTAFALAELARGEYAWNSIDMLEDVAHASAHIVEVLESADAVTAYAEVLVLLGRAAANTKYPVAIEALKRAIPLSAHLAMSGAEFGSSMLTDSSLTLSAILAMIDQASIAGEVLDQLELILAEVDSDALEVARKPIQELRSQLAARPPDDPGVG